MTADGLFTARDYWMAQARRSAADLAADNGKADAYLVRWCVGNARNRNREARAARARGALFSVRCDGCGRAVAVNVDPAATGLVLTSCPACAGGEG